MVTLHNYDRKNEVLVPLSANCTKHITYINTRIFIKLLLISIQGSKNLTASILDTVPDAGGNYLL